MSDSSSQVVVKTPSGYVLLRVARGGAYYTSPNPRDAYRMSRAQAEAVVKKISPTRPEDAQDITIIPVASLEDPS